MNKKTLRYTCNIFSFMAIFLAVFLTQNFTKAASHADKESFVTWNAKGELNMPEGWREWIYVGTPVTPNDMNNGKAPFPEFHNVYIDPNSYAEYKKTGNFPDGTVLIKELVSVGSKAAVSGLGYFQGEFIGLEATIKSKKHHAKEPGTWAYYSFTNPDGQALKKTSPMFETASCNVCHQASAADDWVFTQYYPVLRAAKAESKK